MSKTIRTAVLGVGFMGSMHAAIFARAPGATLVAIADKNRELAQKVAERLPGCRVYGGHEELLAAETLDLISICTPDHLHREPAIAAAQRGVNLFVEKPIASTLDDGEAIVAACESAKVKLGVGYLLRFDPRYRNAKQLLREGKIGAPIHLYARRNSARTEGPKRYGGALPLPLHVTVHDVDLVLWMLEDQRPISVYAQTTNRLLGATGTQDTIGAIVRFSDGALATFESAWALPAGARHMIDARLELLGVDGAFEVQCGDSGLYFADANASHEIDTQHWPTLDGAVGGDLREQLHAVVRWIGGADEPVATGREALRSLDLTRQMMRSAETGEVIRIAPNS
jgi:predicted dehydrogenase